MKKIRNIIIIVIIVLFINKDTRYKIDDELIESYKPTSEYQIQYPVEDYVDEKLNSNVSFRTFVINSLINSEEINQGDNLLNKGWDLITIQFNKDMKYGKKVDDFQYEEQSLVTLQPGDVEGEYIYSGVMQQGIEVSGDVRIFKQDDQYAINVSFLDSDSQVDIEKAILLADDSNAEMLTYLIIEETQKLYGTNLDPDDAAKKYYGSNIEKLAGSISYHAMLTILTIKDESKETVLSHSSVVNISTIDEDSLYINRKY